MIGMDRVIHDRTILPKAGSQARKRVPDKGAIKARFLPGRPLAYDG